jgi:hypothetical protein
MAMRCEVRYWKNDQIKSQITVEADSLEQAIRQHLNEPGWIDARQWPIEHGTAGELFAANPDDPACMIEAVVAEALPAASTNTPYDRAMARAAKCQQDHDAFLAAHELARDYLSANDAANEPILQAMKGLLTLASRARQAERAIFRQAEELEGCPADPLGDLFGQFGDPPA